VRLTQANVKRFIPGAPEIDADQNPKSRPDPGSMSISSKASETQTLPHSCEHEY
jgi:hypothetical protein